MKNTTSQPKFDECFYCGKPFPKNKKNICIHCGTKNETRKS